MASTSLDLSQIKTDALSAASTFRTLIGLGNVNNTSDANKPISSATQSALDGKLSLTGGTLTGLVTANSTANITTSPKLFSFQHNGVEYGSVIADYNNGNGARARITAATFSTTGNNSVYDTAGFTAAGSGVQLYYNNNGINLIFQGQSFNHHVRFNGSDGTVHFGGSIGFTSFGAASGAADLFVLRDAANILGQRNSTNAQRFNLYGTYTDASNYRRLYVSSTTAGAFTLGVEGAGTGASGNTLTVPNAMSVNGTLTMTNTGGGGLGNIQITGGSWWLYAGGTIQARIFNVNGWYGMSDLSTGGLSFGSGHGISWGSGSLNVPASGSITGDLFLYRNAAGQLDIRGDSGLRVRNLANSADAPITAGTAAFSGNIAVGGASLLGGSYAINLPQYTWISWASNAWLTSDPGVGLRLNNCAIQCITYLGFGSNNPSTTILTFDAADNIAQRRSTNSQTLRIYNTFTDASNYIRQSLSFTTYSTTVHAQLAAEGAGTGAVNVPFVITPRGTGAFILGPMPDGTATGGNARGANAVDLQTSRSAATQVASGLQSIAIGSLNRASTSQSIAIGYGNAVTGLEGKAIGYENTVTAPEGNAIGLRNTVSNGDAATCIGDYNTASEAYCLATGGRSFASRWGQRTHACGNFADIGDAQRAIFILRIKTTNNTATTIMLDGSSRRLTIPSGKLFLFTAKIVGVRSDGLRRASYVRKGTIINVAGATSIVGAIEAVGTDVEDDPNLNITITADDTNDALDIQVTGITGETWRWVAVVEGVEVAYGT